MSDQPDSPRTPQPVTSSAEGHTSNPLSEPPSGLATETSSDCAESIDEAELDGVHADLSALCRDILRIIGQLERSTVEEPVGIAIIERLQDEYDRQVCSNAYDRLTELADRGLISKTHYIAQKKRYVLTDTGRAVMEAYATQTVDELAIFLDE